MPAQIFFNRIGQFLSFLIILLIHFAIYQPVKSGKATISDETRK